MVRYALLLEYDGSDYYGWQTQKDVVTVQQQLEKALSSFANHPVATITAGRTDTGVHALNQVVHFDSNAKRSNAGWINAVNSKLPITIRVKQVAEVASNFDARFSALSRTYHYYLLIQPQQSALFNRHAGWYYRELDLELMQQAANMLVGRHDFSAFRASACQANTPTREMRTITIERRENMLRFSLTANAFLHHMVRNIIGALLYVGNGRISLNDFQAVFQQTDRRLAPPTFMPNGLYLADVEYPQAIFTPADLSVWRFN